jgi:nitrogen PTS system EIIA component
MSLSERIRPDCIFLDLQAHDKREALQEVLCHLSELKLIKRENVNRILRDLMNREELGSTGIGGGVAVAHTMSNYQCFAMARCKHGIDWAALDEQPVKLFFLTTSGANMSGSTMEHLVSVSRLVRNKNALDRLMRAPDSDTILEILTAWDRGEIPEPESEQNSEIARRNENSLINKFFEWLLS